MRTFDEAKERAEQRGDEWKFGAIQTDLALIPLSERLKWLPEGEDQFTDKFDSNGCASRCYINEIEAKLEWFYHNGMHPAIREWADLKGYRVTGKFKISDNFIEILSGTGPTGNSLKAPILTICEKGLIPAQMLKMEGTWQEYMNPKRITEEMLELGREFRRRIFINYEQVTSEGFMKALEEDFVSAGVFAWPNPINGVYPRTAGNFTHATALVTPVIHSFDGYKPYLKVLAKDYNFFSWGYSVSITGQNPYPDEVIAVFDVLKQRGLLAFFYEFWKRIVTAPTKPIISELFTPEYPTEKPVEEPKIQKRIKKLVEIMKVKEGWIPPGGKDFSGLVYPKGSRSWRNNNPLNFVYHWGGYKPIYGKVTSDGRFAIFSSKEIGHLYTENFLINICSGAPGIYSGVSFGGIAKSKGYKDSSELSVREFITAFAPPHENNTEKYISDVCSPFGIPDSTKMSYFLV